ncbi:MAG: phosphate--acyl-ACP acyltransferase, partial [Bacteroidota bacterium]
AESFYRIMTKRGVKDDFLARFNYENYGGTPILGTNAPVMVGHGISNARAFKNMILHTREMVMAELPSKIERSVIKNILNR